MVWFAVPGLLRHHFLFKFKCTFCLGSSAILSSGALCSIVVYFGIDLYLFAHIYQSTILTKTCGNIAAASSSRASCRHGDYVTPHSPKRTIPHITSHNAPQMYNVPCLSTGNLAPQFHHPPSSLPESIPIQQADTTHLRPTQLRHPITHHSTWAPAEAAPTGCGGD